MMTSEKAREFGKNNKRKTPKEREEYIKFFVEKLSCGYGTRRAIEAFKNQYNIHNTETPCRYYKKALARIQEVSNEDLETAKAVMQERLTDLYEKAYEGKNYKIALQALKQLSELNGLDAPTKAELNIETNAEFNFE